MVQQEQGTSKLTNAELAKLEKEGWVSYGLDLRGTKEVLVSENGNQTRRPIKEVIFYPGDKFARKSVLIPEAE